MAKLGNTELFMEDALVIAIYFALIIGVGIWSSLRSRKDSISGYFLASRNMHWIPVGASIFASNIGSGHFIGLAGSGASSGIAISGFEISATLILLMLGWFFAPVYMSSGVYTMPEYLHKRFGGQRIRVYLSLLALTLYVFTKISADLYAGAIFINQSIKLDMYPSILVLLLVSAVFTIAGGLNAVIWTDFVQTILMVLGALALSILSFKEVGGYSNLVKEFKRRPINDSFLGYDARNKSCSDPPDDYMSLIRSASDPDLPWTGMLFGQLLSSLWYWCADQVIVQRTLSAKNISHVKGGCILASYLKYLPLFLLVFPGMAASILFADEVACSNPEVCKEICGSELGCTNIAYPKLVLKLMPAGARGMMMSVMLASLMSSLTSIFNSSSTIFTIDIWTGIRKKASEIELLIVGRVFVLFLVAISIAWIPIIEEAQNSQLFHYINSVSCYFAPPVSAVYVLAIFWPRINEKGAFWGLMAGLVTGTIRFACEFSYTVPPCSSKEVDPRPFILSKVNYMNFAIILFLVTLVVAICTSYLTEPIPKIHLHRLTFWSRRSAELREAIPLGKDTILSSISAKKCVLPPAEIDIAYRKESDGHQNLPSCDKEQAPAVISILIRERISIRDEMAPCIQEAKDLPTWKKRIYFICGLSEKMRQDQDDIQKSSLEDEVQQANDIIREKPIWNIICNVNAIILLMATSFIYGFYA